MRRKYTINPQDNFGFLIVIEKDKERLNYWMCKCACGKIKSIKGYDLFSGRTTSCSCKKQERLMKILDSRRRKVINGKLYDNRYAISNSKFYRTWASMRDRCTNKNNTHYDRYSQLGIDSRWLKFDNFMEDMYIKYLLALKHIEYNRISIERVDTNRGYFKDNCKWIDVREQGNNRSDTRLLTYNGETKTLSQWARIFKINPGILYEKVFYQKKPFDELAQKYLS